MTYKTKPVLRKCQIKKGDQVQVITGNDKGLVGTVLARVEDKFVVQGMAVCKKHVKPSQTNPKGGIVPFERAIHVSNLKKIPAEKA